MILVVFLNKGYLERVNHSLSSVLRERSALYQGREMLTQDDVEQLDRLATLLLAENRIGKRHKLYIDAIYFSGNSRGEKTIREKREFTATNRGGVSCPNSVFAKDSSKLSKLSPFSNMHTASTSMEHWLPVYQVTICSEGESSLFISMMSLIGLSFGNISISNAVIPR